LRERRGRLHQQSSRAPLFRGDVHSKIVAGERMLESQEGSPFNERRRNPLAAEKRGLRAIFTRLRHKHVRKVGFGGRKHLQLIKKKWEGAETVRILGMVLRMGMVCVQKKT